RHLLLQRLELAARALEHLHLRVELLARHDIELAQVRAQHRPKIGLQILLHAAQGRRHALEQASCDLIDTEVLHGAPHLISNDLDPPTRRAPALPRFRADAPRGAPKRCTKKVLPRASLGKFCEIRHGTKGALCLRASQAYARMV